MTTNKDLDLLSDQLYKFAKQLREISVNPSAPMNARLDSFACYSHLYSAIKLLDQIDVEGEL